MEKRLIQALKSGQVRGKFDYTDPTHQEKIMFGRTDLVIHLLDRNNISTEGIDEALTFSVHASTEKSNLPQPRLVLLQI